MSKTGRSTRRPTEICLSNLLKVPFVIGFLWAGVATPAIAQIDGASNGPTETITVSARKQAESLQDVPLTVSVIGGSFTERFKYNNIEDVTARIPTLNVQVGGSGSGGQISLRGIGSSNISAAFDSAVAFDFDGVQVSTMRIVQSSFFDVQQIEVLKGPQSLFFGKSASAGVLSIKSTNPTEEFEVGGKASYEFEERGHALEAFVSGPISDTLGFRLAARFNDIKRVNYNTAPVFDPNRGEENVNVRGTLQWDPSDDFSANLKLNYVRFENDGAIRNSAVDCGPNGVADDIILLRGAIVLTPGYDCDSSGDTFFLPDPAPPLVVNPPEGSASNNDGVPYSKSDIFFAVLNMDWDLSDDLNLASVTGYLDQSADDLDSFGYGGILNGQSWAVGTNLATNELEQFSQELRLTSSFDSWFNFMLGAFYEHREIAVIQGQGGGMIGLLAPDPVTGSGFGLLKEHYTDTDAYSVFGSVVIDITDTLELSGGVRWTHEKKVNVIDVPYIHAFLSASPAFIASGFVSDPIRFSDTNWSPEVTLRWQATDNVNLYIAYKTGFKSGGIDNSAQPTIGLVGLNSPDPEVRQMVVDGLVFDSETAEGGEVGVKAEVLDRTLTLNFSAYYYVFDNLQVQNFDAVTIQFLTENAGEVTTKGLDLDFNWATPVEGLSFFGSFAFTDAKYTGFFDPNPNDAVEVNLEGRRVARAPKWSGNIAADLRVPVGNALELGLTANMSFSSSYFTNEDSFEDHIQSGYVTFDAAVSIGGADGSWQLALIGKNLGDKRVVNTSGPRPFLLPTGDDAVWTFNRGRQLFVEGSVRF